MPAIDPAQPIPLYFQLKTLLHEEILSGRYGPGRAPSHRARAVRPVRHQPNAREPCPLDTAARFFVEELFGEAPGPDPR